MRRLALPLAACTVLATVATAASAAPAGSPAVPAEILDQVFTLEEAARYLRTTPAEVETLAREGALPGRRLGGEWRFSRIALLQWLNHDRPVRIEATPRTAAVTPSPEKPLGRLDLAGVSGRGIGDLPAERVLAQVPQVGERPAAPTAEEVALRDQTVLLKGGRSTLEVGLSYSRSEVQIAGVARAEQSVFTTSLTARYGLRDDLQVSAALPYRFQRDATFTTEGKSVEHDSRLGDLSLGLFGVGAREAMGRPNLIWSLQGVAPTGPGDAGLGGGLSATKSYDPVVLFASASYLYGTDTDIDDPQRVLARHNLGLSVGYAFALNESIALTGQVAGTYRTYEQPHEGLAPARERYQLQLGMTYLLGAGLFIEPTVAFGLSDSAPDVVLGVSLPYSF